MKIFSGQETKIKKEAEEDEDDVDGVPIEESGPDPAMLAMRHHVIPGGLAEPEQRDQAQGSKFITGFQIKNFKLSRIVNYG